MAADKRDALEVMKFERMFLERGGYGKSPRDFIWPPLVFEDSPTCLNYDCKENPLPCSDCVLMQLVPPEMRSLQKPCRHIPLNDQGQTVDGLYRFGTDAELEIALKTWLDATIARLEKAREDCNNAGCTACALARADSHWSDLSWNGS